MVFIAMFEHLARGGFKRAFGCGEFIRDFLTERGEEGAPQQAIFFAYKNALIKTRAESRAEIERDRLITKGASMASIDLVSLTDKNLKRFPYRTTGARYHSFVMYFSTLIKLGWVELTGIEELSILQERFPNAPGRSYYRLSEEGRAAPDSAWANPFKARYPILA